MAAAISQRIGFHTGFTVIVFNGVRLRLVTSCAGHADALSDSLRVFLALEPFDSKRPKIDP